MSGLLLEHFHGAATRVGASDTAFPHRETGYNFLVASEWLDPVESDVNIAWTRETYAAMQPWMATGSYMNYLGEDESEDRVAAAYGPNFERLQALKRQYDPDNLFHLNQNIRP
jgi:FAD/FMN-containing dehydrogenase